MTPLTTHPNGSIKSATGGAIPGPKVSRQGSSRSDIPNFGILGDDIDPRDIYSSKRSTSKQELKVKVSKIAVDVQNLEI